MMDIPLLAHLTLGAAVRRHDGFRGLNQRGPVHRVRLESGATAWLVTGYEAARDALTDPRLHGRTGAVGGHRTVPAALRLGMNSHMLNLNPPDHTRLRRLISAAFTRRRMERMRPRVQEVTDGLLSAMSGREEVDLLESLAVPLPIQILSEMLGVPDSDADAFRDWTTVLTASALSLDGLVSTGTEMLEYTRRLLDRKRREPREDLLSALVAVRDGADRLTEDELTSMVFMLLIAGQETTVNLIGNGVCTLLANPDQLQRLREGADLSGAIEEFLRYESPVQAALRLAAEPVPLAGETIEAGSVVIIALLAANRDPARFGRPEVADVHRTVNPHLAFGHGIHHCIGAPLARLEGEIAIGSFLRRYPEARLGAAVEDLCWRPSTVMNGLLRLPVRLG